MGIVKKHKISELIRDFVLKIANLVLLIGGLITGLLAVGLGRNI